MRPATALTMLFSLTLLSAARAQQAPSYDEARALMRSGQMALEQGRNDDALIKATGMLSSAADALDAVGAVFEAAQARLRLLQAASPGVGSAALQGIVPVADKLIEGVRKLGDPSLLGQSLMARAQLAMWIGKPDTAVPYAIQALDAAAKLPSPMMSGAATVVLCQASAAGVSVPGLADRIASAISAICDPKREIADGTAVEVLRQLAYEADRAGLADARTQAMIGAVRGAARVRDMPWVVVGLFYDLGSLASRRLPDASKAEYFAAAAQALTDIADPRVRASATAAYAQTAPADATLARLLTDTLASLPTDAGPEARVGLIGALVRVKAALGQRDELGTLLDEAVKGLSSARSPEERVGLAGQVASMAFESGLGDRAASILKDTLAALPADATRARVSCALDLARCRMNIAQQAAQAAQARGEDPRAALDEARQAAAGELEPTAALLDSLTLTAPDEINLASSAADVYLAVDEPLKAVAIATRVLKSAEAPGLREPVFHVGVVLAQAHHSVGSDEASAEAVERALAGGASQQDPWTLRTLAALLEDGGKADEALPLYDRAIEQTRRSDPTSQMLAYLLFQRAWCLIGLGRGQDAVADVDALDTPEEYLKMRAALLKASVVAQGGDPAAVRAVLGPDRGDVLAQPWWLDPLFDGPARTTGELRRQERFLQAAIAALAAAEDRPAGVACGCLSLAETQNRLREFQAALESATKAAAVIGPGAGGDLYPRVLRAQANAYEGLGNADKAAELRSQADAVQKGQ